MVNFRSDLPEDLRRKLEAKLGNMPTGNFTQIKETLQAQADSYNQTPQAELHGYSPAMCHALRYPWNTPGSPIQFNPDLPLEKLGGAQTFQQIRMLLLAVSDADGVKATASGNFNRKFVEAMVRPLLDAEKQEFLLRYNKVLNEPDFRQLHEARIVAGIAGMLTKRKGIIRVTRKHQFLLEDSQAGALYTRLFDAYFHKFNIGYSYRYGIDVDWIQHEVDFVLYPLYSKARRWMDVESLPSEILHPMVMEKLQTALSEQRFLEAANVVVRYFVCPLHSWGLLDIEWSDEQHFPSPKKVRRNPLFRQFIQFDEAAE